MTATKVCRDCGQEKPVSEFYRADTRDGYRGECRRCKTARTQALRDQRSGRPSKKKLRLPVTSDTTLPCHDCGEEKPDAEFYANPASQRRRGRNARCHACQKVYRETHRARQRDWLLRQKYGITAAEYDEMYERQGGLCAICHQPEADARQSLAVDHCHDHGHVRELLCSTCNRGIGLLKHDPALLHSAISYLERNRPQ